VNPLAAPRVNPPVNPLAAPHVNPQAAPRVNLPPIAAPGELSTTRPCRSYMSMGLCRTPECHFVHARPQYFVVCTFFLQGRCNNVNCRFSHIV